MANRTPFRARRTRIPVRQIQLDPSVDDPEAIRHAQLAVHASASTAVHGVGGSTVESVAGSQAKVDTHASLTTGVHGVGTSTVESAAGAQAKVDAHAGITDAHSATPVATPSRIVMRDAAGRAQFADGADAGDAATKGQLDSHADLTAAHSATSAATANRIVLRDNAGRAQFADGTANGDAATVGQVNAHANATDAHSATASATANRIVLRDSTGRAAVSALGIGIDVPPADLSFGPGADRVLRIERQDNSGAGRRLTIQAGGARAGETNTPGGELRLSAGIATGNAGSFISFYTASVGASGTADSAPTEKMRITAAGNIGIGTTAPTALLHAALKTDDMTPTLRLARTDNRTAAASNVQILLMAEYYDESTAGRLSAQLLRFQYTRTDLATGLPTAYDALIVTTPVLNSSAAMPLRALNLEGPVMAAGTTLSTYCGIYIAGPTGAGTVTTRYALVTEETAGNVGIGTTAPAISDGTGLHIAGPILRIGTAKTPASASATGFPGEICWNSTHLFICIATNTWRRIAHSSW